MLAMGLSWSFAVYGAKHFVRREALVCVSLLSLLGGCYGVAAEQVVAELSGVEE